MKVTVFSTKPYEKDFLKLHNKNKHHLNFVEEILNEETFYLASGSHSIVLFPNDHADAHILDKLHSIRVRNLTLRSAGYEHVDLIKAKELEMNVSYVPDYSPYSIAEHAVTLMMAMNRQLMQAYRNIVDHDFRIDSLMGFDMKGKTIGIIGTGKIGKISAKILHGFGCRLLGYDIEEDPDICEKYGLAYVSLDELCRQSDIISIHCPLTEQTRYMIDKEKMALMKKNVMLVNTARGGIINTLDLIEHLQSGHIGYAALDVYEKEKGLFFYDHSNKVLQDEMFTRLMSFKNVLITCHQAFLTREALNNIAETTIYNLDCFEKNIPSKYSLT